MQKLIGRVFWLPSGGVLPPAALPAECLAVVLATPAVFALWGAAAVGNWLLWTLPLSALIVLTREAGGLLRMQWALSQIRTQGRPDFGLWPFAAFGEALQLLTFGARTDADDVRDALAAKKLHYQSRFSARWWVWWFLAFALPLIGLVLSWDNMRQYARELPPLDVFWPLVIGWLLATPVVGGACALAYWSAQILQAWESAMAAHVDPHDDVQAVVREQVGIIVGRSISPLPPRSSQPRVHSSSAQPPAMHAGGQLPTPAKDEIPPAPAPAAAAANMSHLFDQLKQLENRPGDSDLGDDDYSQPAEGDDR